jgi:serine protease inhibitor
MDAKHFQRTAAGGRALALLVSLALIGCSSTHSNVANNNQPANANTAMIEEGHMTPDEAIDNRLVSANTRFGIKLYSEVAKESAGKNVFISPASVGLALAMTYNGAAGETKQGMERALEIQGMNHQELNRAYAALRKALESPDPKVLLSIANSLWAKKGVTFNPDFIQRNRQYYGAEITDLDFGDPSAPATINSWVSDKTKGKITRIVDNIDPQSVLFLINAIYFKGAWTREFDKKLTKDHPFTNGAGRQKQHPLMHQSGDYSYYEDKDFQAVSLPYGAGRVSMYIFLPAKESSLTEFHTRLSAANWERWMDRFSKTKGDIAVPRFKVEYEVTLNDALKALGMGVAFDPQRADFSGILRTSENAFISRVKHKSFAEVNEEGTEAAAATSVEVTVASAMRPQKPFRMIVDRPFFYAIRDNRTGTLLFLGSITDPM